MENTFKSSVFGGFNRDDVIRYIEVVPEATDSIDYDKLLEAVKALA